MPGWGAPQTTQGFKTGEYAGALVLVTVVAYEPSIPTTYGDKDAVTCHITVCYHPTDSSQNGQGYANARIFNMSIVGSLRGAVGQTVGGRITLGRGQGGNTKYTLDEISDANSVAYLDHYWPTHCETYGVDKESGALIETAADRERKQRARDQEAANSRAIVEQNSQPQPPPMPSSLEHSQTPPPPPPPPAPGMSGHPEQPPF